MQALRLLDEMKARIPVEHRITAALVATFLAIVFCLYIILTAKFQLVFLFIAAIVGFLTAYLGGTKLCLVIYFATTFGSAIRLPFLPTSGNRLAALLLFLSIALELPWKKLRWNWALPGVVFLVFNVYYLTMAAIKKTPEVSFPVESIFYIIVYALIVIKFWEKDYLRYLLVGIAGATVLTIVLPGLIELSLRRDLTTTGLRGPIVRINGVSLNAIIFAYYGCWALPFILTLAMEAKYRFNSLWYLGVAGMVFILGVATLNRQTPILMIVTLFVFFWYMRTRYRRIIMISSLLLGIAVAPIVIQKLWGRFNTVSSVQKDPSLTVRRDKAIIAGEMIKENFWTGIGHNYFPKLHQNYFPEGKLYLLQFLYRRDQWIDLGYLQIMTEYGAIGVALFLLLLITSYIYFKSCYRKSLKLSNPFYTNILASVAAMYALLIVSNLIQDTFVTPKTYILIAVLLATGLQVDQSLEDEESKEATLEEAATA